MSCAQIKGRSLLVDSKLVLADESTGLDDGDRDLAEPRLLPQARLPQGTRREIMRSGTAVFGNPCELAWAAFAGSRLWGLSDWSTDGSLNPAELHGEDESADWARWRMRGESPGRDVVTRQPRPLPVDSRAQWPDALGLASPFARLPHGHSSRKEAQSLHGRIKQGRVPPSGLLELIAFANSEPRQYTLPLHILTSRRSATEVALESGAGSHK